MHGMSNFVISKYLAYVLSTLPRLAQGFKWRGAGKVCEDFEEGGQVICSSPCKHVLLLLLFFIFILFYFLFYFIYLFIFFFLFFFCLFSFLLY